MNYHFKTWHNKWRDRLHHSDQVKHEMQIAALSCDQLVSITPATMRVGTHRHWGKCYRTPTSDVHCVERSRLCAPVIFSSETETLDNRPVGTFLCYRLSRNHTVNMHNSTISERYMSSRYSWAVVIFLQNIMLHSAFNLRTLGYQVSEFHYFIHLWLENVFWEVSVMLTSDL